MSAETDYILSGIKTGLKNGVPELTKSIQSANILKAMELDHEFQLGIFSEEERSIIIESEKELFLTRNKDVRQKIKATRRK